MRRRAERGESSGEGEEPSAQGLGGHHLLAQTDAGRPAGKVVNRHLHGHPGGVGCEAARGQVVEAHAVFEVADGVLDLGVAAMVGLQFQGIPVAVCDQGVIAVVGEERQLGAGRGLHSADDETHRCGVGLGVEWDIGSLCHGGCAVHPVGYGRPVPFGYRLDDIAQTPVLADGDGEADIVAAADGHQSVGVEAAVGPYRELSCGPGAAHPAQRLAQEVCGAPGGVGQARSQPRHQHVSGSGGNGQQRVIAPLAVVVVAAGSLLAQTIGLADGWSPMVNGPVGRSDTGGPGLCQQLPAHPVQLTHVAPAETAQEGPKGGWSLDHTSQHPPGPATTQRVSVVDAVATGPAQRQPGSSACRRRWPDPGHLPGQGDGQPVHPVPRRWASVAGRISPALATRRWSSKVMRMRSGSLRGNIY